MKEVLFIVVVHRDLIVAQVSVHETKYLVSCHSVYQLIDSGEMKDVL